ncbi:MAG: hypothetical protein DMF99_25175 [Acidobacteria bacterium]|nr:MAG: hypothetical protein DMF99_25175 [Acidobacteriota bacterium]
MPAAFYKLARDESRSNPHPVLINEEVSLLSSEQATASLLCGECEERFNSGGETWVLKNCWHSEVDFPLRSNLIAISPSPLSTPGFTIFESVRSEAIDAARLAYFGVSVFWRASVHDWVLMRRRPKRLELGPYEEPLRLFLMGLAGFPGDTLMIISVTSAMDRMRNMLMTFPFLKSRQPEFRQYRFTIPGITFQLFVGKNTPYALRRLSVQSPERHMLMTPDVDDLNTLDGATLISKTRKVGALARPDQPKKKGP